MMRLFSKPFSSFDHINNYTKTDFNYNKIISNPTINTHHYGLKQVALSPNWKLATIGNNFDKSIDIWDIRNIHSRKCIHRLSVNYFPTHLAFFSNGDLVSAEVDEERGLRLKIWDGINFKVKKDESFYGHFRSLYDLKVLPNDRIIALGRKEYEKSIGQYIIEGFLLKWYKDDKPTYIYDDNCVFHTSIAALSFDKFVITSNNELVVCTPNTNQHIHIRNYWGNYRSVVSVDSRKNIFCTFGTEKIRVFDCRGKLISILKGHEENIHAIAVLPNNDIVSSDNQTLRFWSGITYECKAITQIINPIASLLTTPNGQLILGQKDGRIEIREFEKRELNFAPQIYIKF
jgi:WD40 repeat protein